MALAMAVILVVLFKRAWDMQDQAILVPIVP
jgi:hypothetical protein